MCRLVCWAVVSSDLSGQLSVLADRGLTPVQQAMIDEQAVQCGYCYNGMTIKGAELLASNSKPTDAEIRAHMDGHLCRCGGYPRVMKAIQLAGKVMGGEVR